MIKDFLNQVQQESTFETAIFGGNLQIKGRILSPSEIEKASLASTLVIRSLAKTGDLSKFQKMSADLDSENLDEETINRAMGLLDKITPEQMDQIAKSQDFLITQCVRMARRSESDQWERLQMVLSQQEQNPERNCLWIGMLTKNDRSAILDLAMQGHAEAVERLATFRG